MTMPDNPTMSSEADDGSARSGWHDDDVKRALKLAEEAGLHAYRVEIAQDGTISIVVTGNASQQD